MGPFWLQVEKLLDLEAYGYLHTVRGLGYTFRPRGKGE
jgi:DNA-binding response OmpR family regulator